MERLRRREANPWDDVVRFVREETTLHQLQVYLQEHHPEFQLSGDNNGNWQGHVIQRAAYAQNLQLIKDIVDIAGRHLLEPMDGMNLINGVWFVIAENSF